MATSVTELEQRVTTLEQEMATLRRLVEAPRTNETPKERIARLLQPRHVNQEQLSAVYDKAFAEMGIQGEPIGAEELQEMILQTCPTITNEFSRGIVEMREE